MQGQYIQYTSIYNNIKPFYNHIGLSLHNGLTALEFCLSS